VSGDRFFVGVELTDEYFADAQRRIEGVTNG